MFMLLRPKHRLLDKAACELFCLEPSNPWVNGTWPEKGHTKTGYSTSVLNLNPSLNQIGGFRGGLKCVKCYVASGSFPRGGGSGLAASYEQTSSLLFSSPKTPSRPPCDGGILQGLDKGSANSFFPSHQLVLPSEAGQVYICKKTPTF